ncbi:MAG: RNA polymerase sigma factor [Oscillospiraceae bacterium]
MDFENIVDKFSDMITRICLVKCRNYHNAEDCYQNVMLKVYQNLDSISNLDDVQIKKWIIKVTINECINLYRKLIIHRTENIDELIIADDNSHLYDKELLEMVLKLPQKYKDVIYLYYYEQYSIKEISEILGVPEPTIKTHLRRGKERLKIQIENIERLGENL